MHFKLILPTYNPGSVWSSTVQSIKSQSVVPDEVLVIDSGSNNSVIDASLAAGFHVEMIDSKFFNHGGTRRMAVEMPPKVEFVVLMTQDAVLSDVNSIKRILEPFHDDRVAAVCGRQLPRRSATLVEAHARIYNYPPESFVRSFDDNKRYGLKTAFISNSFAAYRVSVLDEVGGFPRNIVFGEDMYVAANMLKAGYSIAYATDACVVHSHDYSLWQEFERYFDMGVFHSREPWIRQALGGAEGEGIKFVVSEIKYLLKHAFWQIPEALLRTLLRYTGFRLGLMEKRLPLGLKRTLAMNKGYFKR